MDSPVNLPIFQVDAFTDRLFGGNPAAVMPLEGWLRNDLLQCIAAENNLSETAFLVPQGEDYALRWFTPTTEVDLCGHATLASAHVLFAELSYPGDRVRFHTRGGVLSVERDHGGLSLDFPAYSLAPAAVDIVVCDALGATASEVVQVVGASKQMFVFEFEEDVTGLRPDFAALAGAGHQCVIATAPGNDCDFVSRFFGPSVGVNEDPVTGSAHCALVPYWSARSGKKRLLARQVSARGGRLECELRDDRVIMRGDAVTYLRGEVQLPD
jgi:PhzF family phenazine biosynthesis protein